MCLKIYEQDSWRYFSAPGFTRKAALKKTKVKWALLNDIDMLFLMVEKGITGGICHAIQWYIKANNKCMTNYDKNKELSYVM